MSNTRVVDNSGQPTAVVLLPEPPSHQIRTLAPTTSGQSGNLAEILFWKAKGATYATGMLTAAPGGRLSDEQLLTRIAVNPEVCGGQPCIKGTRTPIWVILGALADSRTPEQIVSEYPHLTLADVQAALLYAAHQAMHTDEDDDL